MRRKRNSRMGTKRKVTHQNDDTRTPVKGPHLGQKSDVATVHAPRNATAVPSQKVRMIAINAGPVPENAQRTERAASRNHQHRLRQSDVQSPKIAVAAAQPLQQQQRRSAHRAATANNGVVAVGLVTEAAAKVHCLVIVLAAAAVVRARLAIAGPRPLRPGSGAAEHPQIRHRIATGLRQRS